MAAPIQGRVLVLTHPHLYGLFRQLAFASRVPAAVRTQLRHFWGFSKGSVQLRFQLNRSVDLHYLLPGFASSHFHLCPPSHQNSEICLHVSATANLRTTILDFRGFDSSGILILRGGIPRSIGNFPECSSQGILVGMITLGRLGVVSL